MTTIRIAASRYEDAEDCLSAAAADVASARDLAGYEFGARWEDDERDTILLDIPAHALRATDDVAA